MSPRKAKTRSRRYVTAVVCVPVLAVAVLVGVVPGAAWGQLWSAANGGSHQASVAEATGPYTAEGGDWSKSSGRPMTSLLSSEAGSAQAQTTWSVSQPRPLRVRPVVRSNASVVTVRLGQTAKMSGTATSGSGSVRKVGQTTAKW